MRVAVFARFDTGEHAESVRWLRRCIHALLADGRFSYVLLFTDHPDLAAMPPMLEIISIEPSRFFWQRIGQRRRWQQQLEQHAINVILHFGLPTFFTTTLPTGLLVNAADFNSRRLLHHKKRLSLFHSIFVAHPIANEKLQIMLASQYPVVQELYGAAPAATLVETDVQLVKDRFTDGAEFFLYHGPLNDTAPVLNLLKAFSRFKRRQKSGWKLVLAHEDIAGAPSLEALLSNYKYRSDVVLATGLSSEVVESLHAAAWAFVYPAPASYYGSALLQALAWALPVVATEGCRAWTGEAALYFEPGNEVELSDHLMLVYKDEALRNRLAAAAATRVQEFSWRPLLDTLAQGFAR